MKHTHIHYFKGYLRNLMNKLLGYHMIMDSIYWIVITSQSTWWKRQYQGQRCWRQNITYSIKNVMLLYVSTSGSYPWGHSQSEMSPYFSSSLLGPNFLPIALLMEAVSTPEMSVTFYQTTQHKTQEDRYFHSICVLPYMTDHISCPYKITNKIIAPYILIFYRTDRKTKESELIGSMHSLKLNCS